MVLRYYLGDLQETYLDLNNEHRWTTEKRTAMRKSFNYHRRKTFTRDEIVCECGEQCALWERGQTRIRQFPGKDREVLLVLLAVCESCSDSGGEAFPYEHQFEEVIG